MRPLCPSTSILDQHMKIITILIAAIVALGLLHAMSGVRSSSRLFSVDFEVFGRVRHVWVRSDTHVPWKLGCNCSSPHCAQVQGVFFRACAQEQGRNLSLVGWVANTRRNTVQGVVQGEQRAMEEMKVGSLLQWVLYCGAFGKI